MKSDIGLIGLGVMGQNLVLNMASHGHGVTVYNRTLSVVDEFMKNRAAGLSNISAAHSIKELVESLERPRRVMLMVKAGPAVDAVIAEVAPYLEPGDIIIDGGNSYFKDTARRAQELEAKRLLYLGTGVSGGEEGALKGPSIMPGGSRDAWAHVEKILTDIAAKAEDGVPCCRYLGPGGSGHFVKMVHNGIEYADMQLISEAYFLMKEALGMSAGEMQKVFADWNDGELSSYLIEITADILGKKDVDTGKPMVDVIKDTAGQKGTGKWTSQEALDLGVSAPSIAEAVFARCISAIKDERVAASRVLPSAAGTCVGDRSAGDRAGGRVELDRAKLLEDIKSALYASKICAYAQGFALLKTASEEYGWNLDLGEVALLWRAGCIIRAQFLSRIKEAFSRNPGLRNLMLDPYFKEIIISSQGSWRRVVAIAVERGIPVPAFSSALSYYDSYRRETLSANLLQAQRDYFGAHTYERVDRPGTFHTEWLVSGEAVTSTPVK